MDLPEHCSLTLSIVSHGQSALIEPLLRQLASLYSPRLEVIITVNIPEDESRFTVPGLPVRVLRNHSPKGFGANHNEAFRHSRAEYFVVVNPDLRLSALPIDTLLAPFADPKVGASAPVVLNSSGGVEDSARRFPTWGSLARRILSKQRVPDYRWEQAPLRVDWLAGMFVLFRRSAFESVGGFDARRFFMYYEDVDICRRLSQRGWAVMLQPAANVVHDAQRASHRNLKHLRWHAMSTFRYLTGW